MNCIFCKIINKEIPAEIVFENDNYLAFRDINPQAPVHILVIPKKHIENFDLAKTEDIAGMTDVVKELINLEKLDRGYRLVINCKSDGGQEVEHLHLHIFGKRQMNWPPG